MAKHAQRGGNGRFTPAVPGADTSVTDSSADPQAEHDRPADATVYEHPGPATGHVGRIIPQRRARMGDGTAHDYDHEARGFDTLAGGHLRSQAMAQAAGGDPFITSLVSDQRSPEAQARGRARYRAAIDRTGRTPQDDTQDAGGDLRPAPGQGRGRDR